MYRARDTRLERTVALKVSKETFEERFRNEALAVASLNHPHICTLFDVGPDYLVMEYVEGKTLRGPLPVAEALRLALQIADALEHAHRHGIVHRDLKPSNILVTKQGVKVLDFGLAKRLPTALGGRDEPTFTAEGTILGTPSYMAPEQIEGKPADERSDIFAFGLVLYEMLPGRRAFDGDSAAAVARGDPGAGTDAVSALQPATPAAVEQVVDTCLAKDPAETLAIGKGAETRPRLGLRHEASRPRREAPRLGRRGGGRGRRAWHRTRVCDRSSGHPANQGPPRATRDRAAGEGHPPLEGTAGRLSGRSPDRILAALPGRLPQLFLRPLDSVTLTPVPGGEGGAVPFWSPDGRQIGFASVPGGLKKVDLSGGPVQTVCKLCRVAGATWSRKTSSSSRTAGRSIGCRQAAGNPRRSARSSKERRRAPGRSSCRTAGTTCTCPSRSTGKTRASTWERSIRTCASASSPPTATRSTPLPGTCSSSRMTRSWPSPSTRSGWGFRESRVRSSTTWRVSRASGLAQFSASGNGVLAWRAGSPAEPRQPTWFDRSGRRVGTLGQPAAYYRPVLSPDGKSVAICREESATNADIWILDAASGAGRRLTFDPHYDCSPTWSPDGSRIAFRSDRRGVPEIYQKRADGSGDDDLLLASKDYPLIVTDWSADGRFLVYSSPRPRNLNDLFLVPVSLAAERKPIPFLATEALEDSGEIAPNGRWIAYRSSAHGRFEVYVREVSPQGEAGAGTWQISREGGWAPRWRHDGKELFYSTGAGIMAVEVNGDGPSFQGGPPRLLFDPALGGRARGGIRRHT